MIKLNELTIKIDGLIEDKMQQAVQQLIKSKKAKRFIKKVKLIKYD